jgi:transcriptional repressor NF-X1
MLYSEEMPDYKCFCGKENNPEYDKYTIPHSCGDKCSKKRG